AHVRGKASRKGHRVLAAQAKLGDELRLDVRTDGPVGDVTVLRLRDPSRVAIDLSGFEVKGAKAHDAVRFGKAAGAARVVFDLGQSDAPKLIVRRTSTGLTLSSTPAAPAPATVAAAEPAPAPAVVAPAPEPDAAPPAPTTTPD